MKYNYILILHLGRSQLAITLKNYFMRFKNLKIHTQYIFLLKFG